MDIKLISLELPYPLGISDILQYTMLKGLTPNKIRKTKCVDQYCFCEDYYYEVGEGDIRVPAISLVIFMWASKISKDLIVFRLYLGALSLIFSDFCPLHPHQIWANVCKQRRSAGEVLVDPPKD